MSKRIFEEWLETFRDSISGYNYYTDFEKIYKNVEKLKIEINILNSLVGSKNIEQDFENILEKYPECLKVIPILLAVRRNELYCIDENGEFLYNFKKINYSVEQYKYFMRQTGLFELLKNHVVNNLYDYVTGVEVGLDSNGRQNRGGKQMEKLVESFLKKSGVEYYKEMYLNVVEEKFKIDLSAISANDTATKRFDFIVNGNKKIFGIETNFYTSNGSKLNETARSYKMIAEESKDISGFRFVWITDGQGWKQAAKNLKETFLILGDLYNIHDLENGLFENLFK
ncbi:MAG: type II restriction endonuclease [Selenomonadaceae bacterium]|nr:type II restriction endonuclease [Selenomonadaceae bacterium]